MQAVNSEEPDIRMLYKVLAAAAMGNFVEWFDFAIYGYLAITLSKLFFSGESASAALIKVFAVFAVAFALRPIGAIIFGTYGDRVGRKRALVVSILLMAGSTTIIGLLPTYDTIGILAPLLLGLVRCLQGISAGGEYAGACTYVMEHAPAAQRGKFGSYIPVSTFASFAFAAIFVFFISQILSHAQMMSWGWRIPFLMAAPLGLIGLYIRLNLNETPAFRALEDEHKQAHAPLLDALKTQWRRILQLGAFISLTALAFYTFTTYFTTYMQVVGHLPRTDALLVTVIAMIFAAIACPFFGYFTDFVGRRKSIITAALLLIVLIYPSLSLTRYSSVPLSIIGIMLLALSAVLANVITAVLLAETFPTRVRYTASALTYNVAYALFGGTAPLIATWLISVTGNTISPMFYIIGIAVLGLVGGIMLPETSKIHLHQKT